ncbi:Hypothetical protein CAP_0174 [Chondromyces apiculatus DSM 436]|uniref:Uncharacterized protein n=1 Tax=Chondromyces apiculatus DSM 436 TaxID=1192034 RepID=A0A017TFM5_9BACT|nr:Hypothetical protein CAP_0174 [Chondromyces apiculatus DSM 436]
MGSYWHNVSGRTLSNQRRTVNNRMRPSYGIHSFPAASEVRRRGSIRVKTSLRRERPPDPSEDLPPGISSKDLRREVFHEHCRGTRPGTGTA